MQEDTSEVSDASQSLKSQDPTGPPKDKLSTDIKSSYDTLYNDIITAADKKNPAQQTLIRCLSFIATEELFEGLVEDFPEDIRMMIEDSVTKILAVSTEFSRKLKRDWLPHLPQFLRDAIRAHRRPRSLQAIPTFEPLSVPLSPRETFQSPRVDDELISLSQQPEALRVSGSIKALIKTKKFWQEDGGEKDQTNETLELFESHFEL